MRNFRWMVLVALGLTGPALAHTDGHRFYTPAHQHMDRPDLPLHSPRAVEVYPDLEFVCGNEGEGRCAPVSSRYKRYMHLANWRLDRVLSDPGTCVLGKTYGYGARQVWVSGGCVGAFRAPDLRHGDEANPLRQRRALSWNGP